MTLYGAFTTANGDGADASGFGATAAKWAVADGLQAQATGQASTAMGFNALASKTNAVAIGSGGGNVIASSTQATGAGAVAIGGNATAGAQASSSDAIAIGGQSTANNTSSIAIGKLATAGTARSVALGDGSSTSAAVAYTGDTINGTAYTYAGAAGATAPVGVVSVGTAGSATRQLQNVAAGRVSGSSTDAVNGSQLFATDTAVTALGTQATNLGTAVAADLGSGSSYTAAGGLVVPSYSINNISATGANTGAASQASVGAALSALNTDMLNTAAVAASGWNLQANGGTATNIAPGGTVNVVNGSNTTASVSSNTLKIDVSANPTFTTVTTQGNLVVGGSQNVAGALAVYGEVAAHGGLVVDKGQKVDMGGNVIQNVGPGVAGTDAVNLDQLNSTVTTGEGKWITGKPSTYAAPSAAATDSTAVGSGAQAKGVGDVALGTGTVSNGADATTNYTTANGVVQGATFVVNQAPANGAVAVGQRQITQLADGEVSATSTDAVNGSQLYNVGHTLSGQVTTNATNLQNLGNSVALGLGGSSSYVPATGTLTTGLSYGGSTYNSVQKVLDQINGSINSGTGIKYFHGNSTGADSQALGTDSVAIGPKSTATGNASIAEGAGSNAWNDNSIAIGNGASAGISGDPTRISTIAIGNGAKSTAQNSMAIGDGALASGPQATAEGSGAQATAAQSSAFGRGANAGNNGTALGMGALATGTRSTAVGQGAKASVTNATALGQFAQATQSGDVALGAGTVSNGADATTNYTTANGVVQGATFVVNQAPANGAVAVGQRQITQLADGEVSATSTDAVNGSQLYNVGHTLSGQVTTNATNLQNLGNSVALGLGGSSSYVPATGTLTTGLSYGGSTYNSVQKVLDQINSSINGGTDVKYFHTESTSADSQALGTDSVAVGPVAAAYGNGSIAQGLNAVAGVSGTPATANDVAIGNGAKATGGNSIAQGADAAASSADAVAIGQAATATGGAAVSIGGGNTAQGDGAVTIGGGAANTADGVGVLAMGKANTAGKSTENTGTTTGAVALGAGNTAGDAVDATSLLSAGNGAVAIGRNNVASGTSSIAMGLGSLADSGAATNLGTIALGYESIARGGSVAIGSSANADQQAVAIGVKASSTTNAIAIGSGAQANGAQSISIGTGNIVAGVGSGAFGDPNTVNGTGSYAFGNGNTIDANDAFVLGNNVSIAAGLDGAVALGNNTTVAAAVPVASATINGTLYPFAGAAPASVVSVGAAGAERQIANVAAGRLSPTSTDAVNGSQLDATNKALDAVGAQADNSVQYDNAGKTSVTLGGVGSTTPVTLTNVKAGNVATGSTDAVNGSQLYAVQQTASLGWNVTTAATGSGSVSGTSVANVAPGNTMTLTAGNNLIATQTGTTVALGVNPALTGLTSVAFTGGPVLGSDGSGNLKLGDASGNPVKITNVANGTNPSDAVNLGQLQSAAAAVETHFYSVNGGNSTNPNYNNDGATGTNALAAGIGALASGKLAIALGDGALGGGDDSTALGSGAEATNLQSTAVGQQAWAKADQATAIGSGSLVTADGGIAIGFVAGAHGADDVAIGYSATASSTGSDTNVALGANSTADGSTLANPAYNPGAGTLAGTAPVGEVSVGSAGKERRITNVAAGANDTDAVNVSQLKSASVAAADKWIIGNPTAYVAPVATGTDSTAIGSGAVANHANDVALGNGSSTSAASTGPYTINGGSIAATSDTNGVVSVGSAGHERQIQNVAAGTVSATSTDAVNGSQLYAVGTQANTNTTNLQNLGNSVAAGMGGTSSYDAATGTLTTGLSVGGNTYNNVNSALNAIDATASSGWNVTTAATGSGQAHGSSVANVAPGGTHTITAGDNIVATQNGTDVAIGVNPVLTGLTSIAFTGGGPVIDVAGIDMGGTKITNLAPGSAGTDAVNVNQLNAAVAGAGAHYYSVNDGGTPGGNYANNGATGTNALAAGVGATAAGNGGAAVGNNAAASGANSTALGQGATASTANSVALGAGSTTGTAVGVSSATVGGITYGGFAGSAPVGVVSVGSAGAERQITNVAAGQVSATSTDAVNGSQLYSVAEQVSQISTSVGNVTNQVNNNTTDIKNLQNGSDGMFQVSTDANTTKPVASGTQSTAGGNGAVASGASSTAVGHGAQATADNSVAIGAGSVADRADSVSVGSAGNARQITNVAAGTAATDAVNVSQLQASQEGSVQYDRNADGSINYDSITLNPNGGPATIHNVGAGTAATDAVNVGQLQQGLQQVQNWSKSYTDQAVNNLGNKAFAGVASAIAMASMPQAYQPNQSSAGVALGNFHGESGIAVGVSTISESGRMIFKVNASTNTRGDTGVGVGAGVVW